MTSIQGAAEGIRRAPGCSTANGSSPGPASTAGWCRRRRWRSISASAWPTASACSGCRCRARIGITQSVACPADMALVAGAVRHQLRLEDQRSRLDVHAVLRVPRARRPPSGAAGSSAPARARPAWSSRVVLVRRPGDLGDRRLTAPALADVARLRRDRRHRPRPRLHLAGLDADQVVPRPARHGDRHGDHGLRRRRDDRRAAGRHR